MTDAILPLIHAHERFCITTHVRPDGDAIGSQLALGLFLQKLGKRVIMVNHDPMPYNLEWLPESDQVKVYERRVRLLERITTAEVLFIVDANAQKRLGRIGHMLRQSDAKKVLIDHHTEPEDWFDVSWVNEHASSTGELIYDLIAAEDPDLFDEPIATALYTAIMTDTGSFRFSNMTGKVHRAIADLMERTGIRSETIHNSIYDTRSLASLRLMARALGTITLLQEGQLGYMTISRRLMQEVEAQPGDTEGLVNYILSIEGVKAAVMFTEVEKGTKASFRSKGDAHVHEWARAFGGGGHRNASGAFVEKPLDGVIKEVMGAASRFIDFGEADDDPALSDDDAQYLDSLLKAAQR